MSCAIGRARGEVPELKAHWRARGEWCEPLTVVWADPSKKHNCDDWLGVHETEADLRDTWAIWRTWSLVSGV